MTCCRNDLVQVAADDRVKMSSRPPSRCTTPVKYVKTNNNSGCNNICVKQPGGKDFTISLNPSKVQVSAAGGTARNFREQPVSIVINTTPKARVTVHPAFESAADKKGAAIVAAARNNLATRIHSPADNLRIRLVGGSLAEQLGEPPCYNRKMLVKNCGVVSRHRGGPNYSPCRARSPQNCDTRKNITCKTGGNMNGVKVLEGIVSTEGRRRVQLCMPGSGMEVNIRMSKGRADVRCSSPAGGGSNSCSGDRSPKSPDGSANGGDDRYGIVFHPHALYVSGNGCRVDPVERQEPRAGPAGDRYLT